MIARLIIGSGVLIVIASVFTMANAVRSILDVNANAANSGTAAVSAATTTAVYSSFVIGAGFLVVAIGLIIFKNQKKTAQ